jgi:hypothetical protein
MNDSPSSPLPQLKNTVHLALRAWQQLDNTPENLLADLFLVQQQRRSLPDTTPSTLRLATNRVLLEHINELGQHDPEGARILTMRFIDNEIIQQVVHQLDLSEDQVKRRQREAIEQLTRLIQASELRLRQAQAQLMEASLTPPSYRVLFGVDAPRDLLVEQLLIHGAPWVLAIVGIGGIGKTSLADQVVRLVIQQFRYEKIAWLRLHAPVVGLLTETIADDLIAQLSQQLCPHLPLEATMEVRRQQVRQTLKHIAHLIVVDNLELEEDSASLLPLLHDLANPSKFLLTARTHLPGQVGVFSLPLKELSLPDAADLIRHHANSINFPDLANATLDEIGPIYEAIGGNPLALKLVVSLAVVYPLPDILEELVGVQLDEIEMMYRRIYWQTWQSLREESRALLEVMPLASSVGVMAEQMMAMSGLSRKQLLPAINELVNRSLLEVSGTIWERRYSIHRLTETFLRTEIIHWPEDRL